MKFSDIPGLDDVKNRLAKAGDRNHHAQIFSGNEGSANLALALAYATYINCENPNTTDSCGVCNSCNKHGKLIHPDLHFVFPVTATKKITGKDVVSNSYMNEWRSFVASEPFGSLEDWLQLIGGENRQGNISKEESRQIIQKLILKPFEGKYKIMIIWLPEWMNSAAANGILKILEEPPKHTIFILVTNQYDRLLKTITSRAQLVTIRNFTSTEISEYLSKQNIDFAKANKISEISEGNLNIAQKMITEQEVLEDGFSFEDWMRKCWASDFEALVGYADQFHSLSKLYQRNFLINGLKVLRRSLLQSSGVRFFQDEGSDFVKKFSVNVNHIGISQITELLNDAHYHLERNTSAKMTFLDMSLKTTSVLRSGNGR